METIGFIQIGDKNCSIVSWMLGAGCLPSGEVSRIPDERLKPTVQRASRAQIKAQ